MSKETTYAGVLGDLGRFLAALDANAADLGHLEGPRARLAQILAQAQEAAKQQAAFTAGKQESSKRLRTLLTEGQRIANGLQRFVKEHYGLRSEKLAEFGMQPFRGRRRIQPDTPAGPEPPEAPGSTPTPDLKS